MRNFYKVTFCPMIFQELLKIVYVVHVVMVKRMAIRYPIELEAAQSSLILRASKTFPSIVELES